MQSLLERIRAQGCIVSPTILKVDSFLNHQVDPVLTMEIGEQIAEVHKGKGATKVLTLEASGIHFALATAYALRIPFVYAKKKKAITQGNSVYETSVYSYTKQTTYQISVAKEYLTNTDKILLVDDILAEGESLVGLTQIVRTSGAGIVGASVVIEKTFQGGRRKLEDLGVSVEALAQILSLENNEIQFLKPNAIKDVTHSC